MVDWLDNINDRVSNSDTDIDAQEANNLRARHTKALTLSNHYEHKLTEEEKRQLENEVDLTEREHIRITGGVSILDALTYEMEKSRLNSEVNAREEWLKRTIHEWGSLERYFANRHSD